MHAPGVWGWLPGGRLGPPAAFWASGGPPARFLGPPAAFLGLWRLPAPFLESPAAFWELLKGKWAICSFLAVWRPSAPLAPEKLQEGIFERKMGHSEPGGARMFQGGSRVHY